MPWVPARDVGSACWDKACGTRACSSRLAGAFCVNAADSSCFIGVSRTDPITLRVALLILAGVHCGILTSRAKAMRRRPMVCVTMICVGAVSDSSMSRETIMRQYVLGLGACGFFRSEL